MRFKIVTDSSSNMYSFSDVDFASVPLKIITDDAEYVDDAALDVASMVCELETVKAQLAQQEDKYLRLAAEYENYRRRTAKEKESIWSDAKGEAAAAFLPVYDNLERALKQETADEAYKKGVEMTMNQLKTVLEKLGISLGWLPEGVIA